MAINMNIKSKQSNILRKVIPLKNVIVDIVDKNQNVRRACRYSTSKTPFYNKGITYDGNKINQPDLEFGLKDALLEGQDINATGRDKVIIPYQFDKELLKEDKILIFIESPISRIKLANQTVTHEFWITVALNTDYNKLEPYGNERAMQILCYILDDIEGNYLDGVYQEEVGIVKIEVNGNRLTEKISDKGYIATSIPLTVRVSGMRS